MKHFFGGEWLTKYAAPNGKPGFLRQAYDYQDRPQSEAQVYRMVDLAELLFNLQHVGGFDDCISQMRSGQIEPTYAELDFGRMLYVSNIDFRFVKPSGVKGNDYDIEIKMPDGLLVCTDAKCKIEATNFSAETVKNTLDEARKQFPADRPSIIFVKVPQGWGSTSLQDGTPVEDILINTANNFLRSTGRIVAVKYFVSLIHWSSGILTSVQAFLEINNAKNRFDQNRSWDMFAEADESSVPGEQYSNVPQRWRRLINYPEGITP